MIISHSFYVKNPEEFYRFYKDRMIFSEAEPNGAHKALAKLEQGYAYVTGTDGKNVKSIQQAPPGSILTVRLADGELISQVKERRTNPLG